MSQSCPLCGKTKPEEALFCDECTRKIHTEYEVEIPKEIEEKNSSAAENLLMREQWEDRTGNSALSQKERVNQDHNGLNHSDEEEECEREVESKAGTNEEELETESEVDYADKKLDQEPEAERVKESGPEPGKKLPKKKKKLGAPVLFVLVTALLVGAFFMYNATIRKSNLDRGGWDAAVKANSVEGYLAYMEAHPRGAHFEEAQAGLRRLKSEEAAAWEKMKETDNVTELRDFLASHADSPYAPLVRTRLDSLVWIGTLQMNTPESYADYILLTEKGGIPGDYMAEARKRHDLLSRPQSSDAVTLDSIRAAVGGVFIALSALDHNRMVRYLAPTVYRFFNSGAATRERIAGELLVTGAQTEGTTLKFTPDLESLQYELTGGNHYKINVPLRKSYQKDGAAEEVHGYIAHIELDTIFQVVSIFETKPYPEAP
ncbi:hypothetical protein [Proteiniphilum sp. X52]|uniref:hypothetical protein n=1 Tax=Proteiniphilum sp. X52 TaxID=2382159 RepID=UPI000F0A097D|nr:hypothetical protein [Proteiniphilum sp. X52]RNC64582.1 hypothetical protein D7D25_10765 [Proteiniphilum sp. X52]